MYIMKKETENNNTDIVIGAILGSVDGKMLDISNSFPLTLRTADQQPGSNKEPEYVFDTEYLKKMLKFYK